MCTYRLVQAHRHPCPGTHDCTLVLISPSDRCLQAHMNMWAPLALPSELPYLLTPQLLVAMALCTQEVLQQAQQPKCLLGKAGQAPRRGLFDVSQG